MSKLDALIVELAVAQQKTGEIPADCSELPSCGGECGECPLYSEQPEPTSALKAIEYVKQAAIRNISILTGRIEAAKNILECVDMTNTKTEVLRAYNILCSEETKELTPVPGFDEIFAAYDEWYWGKFRNHPERMAADSFFQFLKNSNIIKETV